jgi:hypothetical protein
LIVIVMVVRNATEIQIWMVSRNFRIFDSFKHS